MIDICEHNRNNHEEKEDKTIETKWTIGRKKPEEI